MLLRPGAVMGLLRHGLVWLVWSVLVVAGLGIAGGLGLAWRLNQGPLDVTAVVTRVIVSQELPVAVRVRRATLSWNGVREGLAAPISLAFDRFAVVDARGQVLDHVDHAAIALAPRALMLGRIAPFSVEASGGALRLRRRADGFVELAPGLGVETAGPARAPRPGPGAPSFWHWIRLARLHAMDLTVADDATRLDWGVRGADAVVTRAADGAALTGRLQATLSVGQAHTHVVVALMPRDAATTVHVRFTALDPSTLPPMLPAFERIQAPVSGEASATLDADLAPRDLALQLVVGGGTLGGIPVRGAALDVGLQPAAWATLQNPGGQIELREVSAALGGGGTVGVSGTLQGGSGAGAALAGRLTIVGDGVPLAGIGAEWPAGVAKGARRWITANLTAGTVHALRVVATLASRDGLDGLDVTDLVGGFEGDGLEAHWLRPIAPITDGRAILRFEGTDALTIAIPAGHEGRLVVDGSAMRISGLLAPDQVGAIELRLSGDLGETLALLASPRLHLLSTRPLPFTAPSGEIAARVGVTLPLDDGVTMDRIAVTVQADLARVHLGDVALGRALDDGALHIDADTAGLAIKGSGRFAGLPVTLAAGFDFRAGGPGDVTESADVSTEASPVQLGQAGLPVGDAADAAGLVGLAAHWRQHRDGTSTVVADADLSGASLALPVGWSKQMGQPASVHLALGLSRDGIAAITALGATGPDLDLAAHGEVAAGRVRAIVVDRARLGRTRLAGRVDLPSAPGGPYRVHAAGPVLDLSWRFAAPASPTAASRAGPRAARAATPPAPARVAPGPRWEATLDAGQVDLANDASFRGVHVHFTGAGARVAQGEARAAGVGTLDFALKPAPGGRALTLAANDAGRLLAAVDLSRRVHGGAIAVSATIPDVVATPVTGNVNLTNFRIDHVPAVARFLRDLTVYGLADPAPAHGISVTRVVLPFSYAADGTITLDGARAFQSAIGLTAKGTIDTSGGAIAVDGTIVPAYAFNALPGRIPVIGKIFSPERGGGLFAATYKLRGTLDAPKVSVNPLAALVPGMLRGLLTP